MEIALDATMPTYSGGLAKIAISATPARLDISFI
jgi:hypothetical protein